MKNETTMEKTTHTPGPWGATKLGRFPDGYDWMISDEEHRVVAQIQTDAHLSNATNQTPPDYDANARLIAAAPDGLAFAESFVQWAIQMRSVGKDLPGMQARMDEAWDFIEKATGQAK